MSREVLEDALCEFDGTIVAVSHDRYFIKKLATRMLAFEDGGIRDYAGGYEDYLSYISRFVTAADTAFDAVIETESKKQYLKSKQESSEKRRLANRIKRSREELANIEKRLDEISAEIEANPSNSRLLTELFAESEELESRMMTIMEELDEMGEDV